MLAMPVLDVARILTRLCSNAIPFLPRGPFRRSTGSVNLVALQAASRSKNDCRLKRIPASFRLLMQQVNLGIIGGDTVDDAQIDLLHKEPEACRDSYAAGQSGHHRRRHRWR